MGRLIRFLKENKVPLAGMLAGLMAGYLYWYHVSCYRGTLPMSSECWVNCVFGVIAGGFVACLIQEYIFDRPVSD